jgi:hypothetical protein
MRYSFAPFLVIGIAFVILGNNGQKAFFAVGLAFIALGLVMAIKMKRR